MPVARAALDAGATWLGVARSRKASAARRGDRRADPAPVRARAARAAAVVAPGLTPVVYTDAASTRWRRRSPTPDATAARRAPQGRHRHAPRRLRARRRRRARASDRGARRARARRASAPTSRSPTSPTTRTPTSSSTRFDAVLDALDADGLRPPLVHAANSAGLLAFPARATTSCASASPLRHRRRRPSWPTAVALRPALSLQARVSYVKTLPAGARVSYGLRYEVGTPGRGRHRARRVRRRRAAQPRPMVGGEVLVARPTPPDRRHGDDGPAAGRRRRRAGRGRRRGRAASAARATTRSPPTTGPSGSARSPTRSSAASAPAVPRTTRDVGERSMHRRRSSAPALVAGAAAGAIGARRTRASARSRRGAPPRHPDAGTARSAGSTRPASSTPRRRHDLHHRAGDGPPIVLCRTASRSRRASGRSSSSRSPPPGFRAVAFDHRGHGESAPVSTGHSLDNLADDVRTVLEGLDLRDVVLVGHSMGGIAVQAFASATPTSWPSASRARAALHLVARPTERRRALPRLDRAVVNVGPVVGALCAQRNLGLARSRASASARPAAEPRRARRREMIAACAEETTQSTRCRALLAPRPHRGAAEVRIPTLVVCGTADVLTPPARRPPHRGLIPAPGSGVSRAAGTCSCSSGPSELDALIWTSRARCRRTLCRPAPAAGRRPDVITDVAGVRVGHWTGAGTGVTVVLLPPGTVGSGEVRGGAPATREPALLEPTRTVEHVDAIVLTGGSAFGLATADGVMRAPRRARAGLPDRAAGPCRSSRPRRSSTSRSRATNARCRRGRGRAAAAPSRRAAARDRAGRRRARRDGRRSGAARDHGVPGGLGSASARRRRRSVVAALAVVNAIGDVLDPDGTLVPRGLDRAPPGRGRRRSPDRRWRGVERKHHARGRRHRRPAARRSSATCSPRAPTTAWPGRIHPSHTRFDGDLVFAVATGVVDAHLDRLRVGSPRSSAEAVRDAVAYHRETP